MKQRTLLSPFNASMQSPFADRLHSCSSPSKRPVQKSTFTSPDTTTIRNWHDRSITKLITVVTLEHTYNERKIPYPGSRSLQIAGRIIGLLNNC